MVYEEKFIELIENIFHFNIKFLSTALKLAILPKTFSGHKTLIDKFILRITLRVFVPLKLKKGQTF